MDRFIGKVIKPPAGAFLTGPMVTGEPSPPTEFNWQGRTYHLKTIVRRWKEHAPCRNGSGERYLRRHWYRVETREGPVMTLYFDRQPRPGRKPTERWCLYTTATDEQPEGWGHAAV